MRRLRDDRGTVVVITVVFMAALLAMAAFAVDAGSWYRADRQLQNKADAAALAGVQLLPSDPGGATTLALEYASKNGSGPAPTVTLSSSGGSVTDTITVEAEDTADGFFSKILDIDSVAVAASAAAKVSGLGKAKFVAPITVSDEHPMLVCVRTKPPASCYGATSIHLEQLLDVPGAFGMLTLNQDKNVGSSTLADWITSGYDKELPANTWYDSVPGAKFNSDEVLDAMNYMISKEADLLFPVYSQTKGNGSNGSYYIIGWVVFQPTGMSSKGGKSYVDGIFKGVIWQGAEGDVGQDFGVRVVRLIS